MRFDRSQVLVSPQQDFEFGHGFLGLDLRVALGERVAIAMTGLLTTTSFIRS